MTDQYARDWTVTHARWAHDGMTVVFEELDAARAKIAELEKSNAEWMARASENWKEKEAANEATSKAQLRVMWLEQELKLVRERNAYYVQTLKRVHDLMGDARTHTTAAIERVDTAHRKPEP